MAIFHCYVSSPEGRSWIGRIYVQTYTKRLRWRHLCSLVHLVLPVLGPHIKKPGRFLEFLSMKIKLPSGNDKQFGNWKLDHHFLREASYRTFPWVIKCPH